jgi:hypothetical protein
MKPFITFGLAFLLLSCQSNTDPITFYISGVPQVALNSCSPFTVNRLSNQITSPVSVPTHIFPYVKNGDSSSIYQDMNCAVPMSSFVTMDMGKSACVFYYKANQVGDFELRAGEASTAESNQGYIDITVSG